MPPKRYYTRREFAEMVGLAQGTISRYDADGRLPDPDVILGAVKGYSQETIDKWAAERPGRGFRSDLKARGDS